MRTFRLFVFTFLLVSSSANIVQQEHNDTERAEQLKELLGIPLPTLKIPDLPDSLVPSVENGQKLKPNSLGIALSTVKIPIPIPTIKLPDLIPTALPKIILPTLPPIKLPTIPNILPTAPPNIAQEDTPDTPYTLPYPLPSDVVPIPFLANETTPSVSSRTAVSLLFPRGGNLVCDICENTVVIVKSRFQLVEKAVRNQVNVILTNVCTIISKVEALSIFGAPCNYLKSNLIDKAFKTLDDWENTVTPKGVCRTLPFCK
ncbi:unnamed protein product [Caenorhabditis sp. 36 PRJEB53466]|nr:unnamed protein product [Caenorhabditis sp. 36 PRJEB53466]